MIKPEVRQSLVIILVISVLSLAFFVFLRHLKAIRRPNIILITLDALRSDHLGCYGYMRDTSPTIDRLAREGIIFTNYIAPSSHTAPSNASLITSTYPNVHNVKDWGYQFSPGISTTLPMILKKHGYNTAFISDQLALPLIKGFERGFNTFNTINAFTYGPVSKRKRVIEITDWAINWLRNNKEKKFFLWIYYLSPHGPYLPSSPYDKMFVHDQYYKINKSVPISEDLYSQSPIGTIPRYLTVNGINDVGYYISQYDGEIRRVDDQIGRLLSELKNEGIFQNAIIIINSDHGEALGEHERYFCHANSLYEELIRIPLIIWSKNMSFGRVIASQVRTIDLMPTILNMLGIRPDVMQGQSFLPLINGGGDKFPLFAYGELFNLVSVRTNGWKLIYDKNNSQYELYDLKNDPRESRNLALEEKNKFEYLKQKLREYMRRPQPKDKTITPALSRNEREMLKSLGYSQ